MAKPITVWSLVCYLTEVVGATWRDADYTGYKIIKLLKAEPFNGYFQLMIGARRARFDASNCEEFLPPLFKAVANKIAELVPDGKFSLVPIPNSTASVSRQGEEFRTLAHARAIAQAIGARADAVPALLWKQEKLQAHRGGSRDPQVHCDNLVVVQKPQRPVVLFDDVMTTGSQMIGACRRFSKSRIAAPLCGIVVGRATKEQKDPVIAWRDEQIETEITSIDWDF